MRNIIMRGQGSGKTKELLLYAKENDAIVLTRNPYALREKAYAYGIVGLEIYDYATFDTGAAVFNGRKVVFHKLDETIADFCKYYNCDFIGATMNKENAE